MKKEGVGSITKQGGFVRIIREANESGEPIAITRGNDVVAIVVPVSDSMIGLVEQSIQFAKILRKTSKVGNDEGFEMFLLGQIMLGVQAKAFLTMDRNVTVENFDNGMSVTVQRGIVSEIQNQLDDIATEISRKAVHKFEQWQNSSEEGGSVLPMTTARADVSEVMKQAGGKKSPASSRKRGRKKQE